MRTTRGRVATNSTYLHFGLKPPTSDNKPIAPDLFGEQGE